MSADPRPRLPIFSGVVDGDDRTGLIVSADRATGAVGFDCVVDGASHRIEVGPRGAAKLALSILLATEPEALRAVIAELSADDAIDLGLELFRANRSRVEYLAEVERRELAALANPTGRAS